MTTTLCPDPTSAMINGENCAKKARLENHMEEEKFLFTSESVSEGHPDKMCDQISDAILDAHLEQDPDAKVSVETATKTGMIVVLGKVRSKAIVDYPSIIRRVVHKIGYSDSSMGFDFQTCGILVDVQDHSYFTGVDDNYQTNPGDQGLVFGYASNECAECMPLTLMLGHKLNAQVHKLRRNGIFPWARPDSKTQVTMEYEFDKGQCKPKRVHTVVISVQHSENISLEKLRAEVLKEVVCKVIPSELMDSKTVVHINPCGTFIHGGPMGDAGLTGRKVIVDTYGGWGAHGGGAFSGKDPSKIRRSAAYAARWVAKSLVHSGLCARCLIQLSYAVGNAKPISITVFTYGTSALSQKQLLAIVEKNFDLTPTGIVKELDLKKPIYEKTAENGHFGHDIFSWEKPKSLKLEADILSLIGNGKKHKTKTQ